MLITYAVVSVPQRRDMGETLANTLNASLITDHTGEGHINTHRRAWADAPTFSDWHIVLEDDAQPCPHFTTHMHTELHTAPPDTIISAYMGTSHPIQAQPHYRTTLRTMRPLTTTKVWHAVALAIPTHSIPTLLTHTEHTQKPWDEAVTAWAEHEGMKCKYTLPSHANHADTKPTIPPTQWQPRNQPRHAHLMCQ